MRTPRLAVPVLLAALAGAMGVATPAAGQLGGSVIPPRTHGFNIEELYSGEYRRAERGFRGDLRSGLQIGANRWVDSICFHAFLGETYYRQGRTAEALTQFDQACSLILAYPDWLRRVKFDQTLRTDPSPRRRIAPWGPGIRQPVYGIVPDTMLVSRGRIDNTQQAEQGGVIEGAQFWPVNVVEVIRSSALAIRRRSELLGPLAPTDRISKQLVDTLGRNNLTRGGHWSQAWIALLLGTAQLGMQQNQQAFTSLRIAERLEGRLDHSLTGAALLGQAELARRAGKRPIAAALYLDAQLAAFAYQDLEVLSESVERGYRNHAAAGGGVYAPLEPVAQWSRQRNIAHLNWVAQCCLAENLAETGNPSRGAQVLPPAKPRRRDLATGRAAPLRDRAMARILAKQGAIADATQAVEQCLRRQATVSLVNFQIAVANARFDDGSLSPRLAVGVYGRLLSDPSIVAWQEDPFDALATLRTAVDGAADRLFASAVGREEWLDAINSTELAKRRRFYRSQPLAGRMASLRRLLDTPPDRLSDGERASRNALAKARPKLALASDEAARLAAALAVVEPLVDGDRLSAEATSLLKQVQAASRQREALLFEAATARLPAPMLFPPAVPIDQVQSRMAEGEALLVFHQAAGALHGFLVVAGGQHYWQLNAAVPEITREIARTLRSLGNASASRPLPAEEAAGDDWRAGVDTISEVVLGNSRLDPASVTRIVVVPDGPLWHLPMEVLSVRGMPARKTLRDAAPIRTCPTIGLAFSPPTNLLVGRTGLLFGRATGDSLQRATAAERQRRLRESLAGAVVLPSQAPVPPGLLAATADQVVAEMSQELSPADRNGWAPLVLGRSTKGAGLEDWMARPPAAPASLVLSGVTTAAAESLKPPRRGAAVAAPGPELFHAACGLLGAGVHTALVSRWQTGGEVHAELIREFAREVGHVPADEAWRRSVSLARGHTMQPDYEPRLDWTERDGDPPTASHPLFWAGYLLLDTGFDPTPDPPAEEVEADVEEAAGDAAMPEAPQPDAAPVDGRE
ncbi:MAG: hypothetical protein AAGJ46_18950 [Planctomycetota bacterium]